MCRGVRVRMVREGMSAIPENAPEPAPPDEPGRTTSEDADLDELHGLARTLAQTLAPGGSAPDDAAALQGWVEGTTGQQIRISQSQIEALIALGAFGRVVGEGRTRLVAVTQSLSAT